MTDASRPQLLTVEEARGAILAHATPLPVEDVRLDDALGRVLAEVAVAGIDLPPFPSSAMDGFAVRSADTPGALSWALRSAAGSPAPRGPEAGEAIAIATGAVVPDGADAVVPIERVTVDDHTVLVPNHVPAGLNVRGRGGDVTAGDLVLQAGTRVGAAHLAALAACGIAGVRCARRPTVAVVATGSELCEPGVPLEPGQIYESNSRMLAAALAATGARVERLAAVEDTAAAHTATITRALEADVAVTSGGVSVGTHDLVRRVLDELGVREIFWGVAMRPGKPLAFGVRGGTLVFGLPGNPVSSLVAATLFVAPSLLALQGAADPGPVWDTGILAEPLPRSPERDDFARARAWASSEGVVLTPVTGQESHMIVRAAAADALVHVPRGQMPVAAGETVRYTRFG